MRMNQLDMFGSAAAKAPEMPTAETVRPRVEDLLTMLRASEEMPWAPAEMASWTVIFPQMINWLPESERAEVLARFEREISRLKTPA